MCMWYVLDFLHYSYIKGGRMVKTEGSPRKSFRGIKQMIHQGAHHSFERLLEILQN